MAKCKFCGNSIPRGTGKIYVQADGKISNLCSMKCEKNMFKLKRKPIATKWSKFRKKVIAKVVKKEDKK